MAPRMQQDIEMGYRGSEAGNEAQTSRVCSHHVGAWVENRCKLRKISVPVKGKNTEYVLTYGQRVDPGSNAASIASAISHWSVQWVARCRFLERSEILPCSGIPEREHLGVPRLNRASPRKSHQSHYWMLKTVSSLKYWDLS